MQVNTAFKLKGLVEITPSIWSDERGHFFESYRKQAFIDIGIPDVFVQDNQSFSSKGVVRGLHFQYQPHGQGKMVRVLQGSALDVVVDLRKDSPTFGQHEKVFINAEKANILWVPVGFAHGFSALEDVIFYYKCTSEYNKTSEGGLLYNDPALGIDWEVENPIVSSKDLLLPKLSEVGAAF